METPRWREIYGHFASQIEKGTLAPGDRLPGEQDVATEFGVSRPTAQKAIQALQRDGLVQRKRRWGTVVADPSASPSRVGLLVDLFAQDRGFPQPDFIRGIQDGLGEDIALVVAESGHDGEREMRSLRRLQSSCDGILWWPVNDARNTVAVQRMVDSGYPIVSIDRVPTGLRIDATMSEHEGVSLRALRELEARGHERIGFLSFDRPDMSSVTERHQAFLTALRELGIENSGRYERWIYEQAEHDPARFAQVVADALFAMVRQPDGITALFCVQDALAVAAISAAKDLGIAIPDELEVATFNDWPIMQLSEPWRVHRIVQRHYDLGFTAARRLTARISGDAGPVEVLRVPADFVSADAGLGPGVIDRIEPNRLKTGS